MRRAPAAAVRLLAESAAVSATLFRIMIPVILGVRILELAGGIGRLGDILSPAMGLVGLPGSMGLVWATAMITNLYGGIVAFVSIAPSEGLTVAQVTVVTTMMLIAHSLPVELGVARQAGARVRFMALLRIAGAFALGFLLDAVFEIGGFLRGPAAILWEPAPPGSGWGGWALGQARNLVTIFVIVTVLIALMKILEKTGLAALIDRMLRPLLVSMGIGPSASTITVLGMILGLSYGGGLIIRGARSGGVPPRDVFFSLCLMGLAHSVIEDSMLMLSLGASIAGVLVARLAFAWLVLVVLVRLFGRVGDGTFYRWFCRPPKIRS